MALIVPLPESVRQRRDSCTHPGVLLDKFVQSYDPSGHETRKWQEAVQRPTAEDVARVSQPPSDFDALSMRWIKALQGLNATVLRCTTTGPLTLHLARASALENAGICLHPLYGFAYLPGSGLKGMTRAYAETIWLAAQKDAKQAWRQIEDVFGWAPNPDRRRQIEDSKHPAERRHEVDRDAGSLEIKASSGNVVFHDAWPESWPQLGVDIVNNHHPDYYQAKPEDNEHPPGDWENPNPVYFLAVKPGTTFQFALAKRRADVLDGLVVLAREWLLGALCHLGAGAKTVAGYGTFKPASEQTPPLSSPTRSAFETTIELVTPGFLAGALQRADDCELRPASLRGLLRWWWRTLHVGFMDVKTLRALEAAIWGDTVSGGAVRIIVENISRTEAQPYDKRSKANFNDQQKVSAVGIPKAEAKKTTQGLWYVSFGMDEMSKGQRKQRHYLEPGSRWRLRLIARPTQFFIARKDAKEGTTQGKPITAEQTLNQATDALWLLGYFGGVGSKAGKGFGSLTIAGLGDWNPDAVRSRAAELRGALMLNNTFSESGSSSASFQQILGPVEVAFSWPSVWSVLDQVGFAYQTFAKEYRHRREKMALGLPRRIGPPVQGTFNPKPPVTLDSRHTSPIHLHVEPRANGWVIRAVGFPASRLPDLATSRTFLEQFLKEFGEDLQRRAALPPPPGPGQGTAPRASAAAPVQTKAASRVKVKFRGPHENLKNAFWVQEEGKKRGLLKYGTPRSPLPDVDSEIEVYPTNDNPNSPEYRWDAPPPNPPQDRGPRRGPPRRR